MSDMRLKLILSADNKKLVTGVRESAASVQQLDQSMDKAGDSSQKLEGKTKKTTASIKRLDASLDKAKQASGDLADDMPKLSSSMDGVTSAANRASKVVAGVTVALVAGVVSATKSTLNYAREVENLSRLSGTSAQDFQRLTFAAEQYSVSQEKVGDILKDVSDKVGDFLQTGGGPLADFFENIAPQVGVTAEEFGHLSGKDALGLYVSSLEKANVSQNEMTFYMEAIASDATLLLPLLKDNGTEYQRLAKEADQFGVVLSSTDLSQLEEAQRELAKTRGVFRGLTNEVALGSLPVMKELTELLSDEDSVAAARALGEAIAASMKAATKAIRGTIQVTQFLAEEVAAIRFGVHADDIVRLEDQAGKIKEILNGNFFQRAEKLRFFGPDGIVAFYTDDELRAELQKVEQQIADYYNQPANQPKVKLSADDSIKDFIAGLPSLDAELCRSRVFSAVKPEDIAAIEAFLRDEDERIREAYQRRQQMLNEQLSAQGITKEKHARLSADLRARRDADLHKLSARIAADALTAQRGKELLIAQGFNSKEEQQTTEHQQRLADIKASIATEALTARREQEILEAQGYHSEAERAEAEHQQRLRDIKQQREDDILGEFSTPNTIDDEIVRLNEVFEQKLELVREQYGQQSEMEAELVRQKEKKIAALELQSQQQRLQYASNFFGGLAQIAAVAGGKQSKLYKAAAIAQAIVDTYKSATASYAAMAGIPVVGPALGAAAASAAIATGLANVAAIRSQNVAGIAHGGLTNVPSESTYLLQKNERVLSPNQNADFTRFIRENPTGGNAPAQPTPPPQVNVRVMNVTDPDEFGGYLESDDGERLIMNTVRRNGL